MAEISAISSFGDDKLNIQKQEIDRVESPLQSGSSDKSLNRQIHESTEEIISKVVKPATELTEIQHSTIDDTIPVSNTTEEPSHTRRFENFDDDDFDDIEIDVDIQEPASSKYVESAKRRLHDSIDNHSNDDNTANDVLLDKSNGFKNTEKFFDSISYASEHPWKAIIGFTKKAFSTLKHVTGKAMTVYDSFVREQTLNRKIQSATKIHSNDMTFANIGGALILIDYYGADPDLVVPASVDGKAVISIHPDAISGKFLDSRTRKVKRGLRNDASLRSISNYSSKSLADGITSIQLPNTLKSLFGQVFAKCNNLEILVIPASVRHMTNDVVEKSGIKQIYFNGLIPPNFDVNKFDGEVYTKVG